MTDSVHGAQQSGTYDAELSDRQLFLWGALGGFFFVAVTAGLFDHQKIEGMLENSGKPVLQIVSLTLFSVMTVVAGAAWARVHKPLRSALVALQLGTIAPLAINALISGFAGKPAAAAVPKEPARAESAFAPVEHTRGFSLASADSGQTTAGPTVLKCIVRSVVKKPC